MSGVEVREVTVRDQRTRWGSCSTSGQISLNWRLVQAPGLCRRLHHTPRADARAGDEPLRAVLGAGGGSMPAAAGGRALAEEPRRRARAVRCAGGPVSVCQVVGLASGGPPHRGGQQQAAFCAASGSSLGLERSGAGVGEGALERLVERGGGERFLHDAGEAFLGELLEYFAGAVAADEEHGGLGADTADLGASPCRRSGASRDRAARRQSGQARPGSRRAPRRHRRR